MIYIIIFIAIFLLFIFFYHQKKVVAWKYPRVLMYHMVREHIDGAKFNKLRVIPEQFEQQVRWLKEQGFTFVTMQELIDQWGKLPEKTVAITFDDGYLDNLENAFPILEKYQAKATIYVVVDRHNRDWSVYKKAHHNTGELMQEPKLTDQQVIQLAQSGLIEIGSHTMTHSNLKQCTDEQSLAEIVQSKHHLQQLIGQDVNSFAYPFGIYLERDVHHAQQAGYLTAVTTVEGIDTTQPDFLQLKRIKVSGKDGLFRFKRKMMYGKK